MVNVGELNINILSGADIRVIRTIMEVAINATCFTNVYIVCGGTDLRSGIDKLANVLMENGV